MEARRLAKIAENKALLESLGLVNQTHATSTELGDTTAVSTVRKRKLIVTSTTDASVKDDSNLTLRRKSSRLSKPPPRYTDTADSSLSSPPPTSRSTSRARSKSTPLSTPDAASPIDDNGYFSHTITKDGRSFPAYTAAAKIELGNPVYGEVANVTVGQCFESRSLCAKANIHRPWVAGIHGHRENGCYSIALSGGYEDDIDEGERFTYTGSGGRELKKNNLRTADQSKDQQLNDGNQSLIKSFELKKPVRVVRGFKGDKKWSPEKGYRYDGLYMVERWWMESGQSGYQVYRYLLVRVEGQPSLTVREE